MLPLPVSSWVTASDECRLAVYDHGGDGPTVLCVHGFPDDHSSWDELAHALASTTRVVSFDVRGSGRSDRPRAAGAYRLDRLAGDIAAVIEHFSAERPVHLVAHDWGSVAAWHTAADPGLAPGIASLTSISGPYLDAVPRWALDCLRGGTKGWRSLLGMWKSPFYMGLFATPLLGAAACRSGAVDWTIRQSQRLDRSHPPRSSRRSARDNWPALRIYRANLVQRLRRPRPQAVSVPVLAVVPRRDLFVTVDAQTGPAALTASKVRTLMVDGGHWVHVFDPLQVAKPISEFITAHDSAADQKDSAS